ncbi:mechanosensitive ion channel family protein [Blastopirellula marina]|uniref:Mechanosensitive ion channel protein MscS n=1 Tax=Blastopirellula marina TaxID=124 RepID=A0A2S8GUT1_9BACT|nr:mechanosensitive ion channel family protein [Blastopirellula marina]PQO48195.1 mechanosensitive ion channel protein MscS [Blastopirellula marina]
MNVVGRIVLLAVCLLPASGVLAQDAQPASTENAYKPVTTIDPAIPIDQLMIMVRPLTKQELEGEAKAWFELLRNKSRQIAAARLGVKKTNLAMSAKTEEAAKVSLEEAKAVKEKTEAEAKQAEKEIIDAAQKELGVDNVPKSTEGVDKPEQETPNTEENTDAPAKSSEAADASKAKESFLADVSRLQDQRTAIVDRLQVVLDSLERKGGEVEDYHKYMVAVSGIEVDTSDVAATWSAVNGWIYSKEGGYRVGWNLAKFLLILLITWGIAKIVQRTTNWLMERRLRLSRLAESLISRVIKNVVMVVGFAVALTALEIDITPIVAAIGATGLVIGLALQGTLSNFASGLMILINRPFDVGDVVTAGGVTGVIHQMNLVSTTFRTFDNQTIHVPNNEIWNNVITNITANPTRRVDLEFGIGYDDDFEKAEQIIREVVENHPLVLHDPEPQVVTHALADSSVNIVCRPWAKTSDWWPVKTDVTRAVKRRFDEEGISIPYPQQDVHFYTKTLDTVLPTDG